MVADRLGVQMDRRTRQALEAIMARRESNITDAVRFAVQGCAWLLARIEHDGRVLVVDRDSGEPTGAEFFAIAGGMPPWDE